MYTCTEHVHHTCSCLYGCNIIVVHVKNLSLILSFVIQNVNRLAEIEYENIFCLFLYIKKNTFALL